MGELIIAKGLDKKQLEEIKQLEEQCLQQQKLSLKLNWDMLQYRSLSEANDFLYYEDNQLIGYLGLYGFGPRPKEIELTGMVHPGFRGRGIFSSLYKSAMEECIRRGAGRILIISERASLSGKEFVSSINAAYVFSEFRMVFQGASVPKTPEKGISIRLAKPSDFPELNRLDELCFGVIEDLNCDTHLKEDYRTHYVILKDDVLLGKIGTTMEGESAYIFGFAIKPEFRGQGFGRAALTQLLNKLLSENIESLLLEVAVENDRALSLYTSCGFEVDTVYDYYEVALK